MPTLLLADHDNKSLKDATAKALTAAKGLGADVHILVVGHNCQAAAEAAAKLDGVKKVLLADAPAYEHLLAEPVAALIVSLAGPYEAIMGAATTTGKNIMPRVAALLDVMQISEVIKIMAAGYVRAADLCRQRHPDGALDRCQEGHHGAHRHVPGNRRRHLRRADRAGGGRGRPRHFRLCRRGALEIGTAGTDLGKDHHFRRPGDAKPRELHQVYRAGRRQARRGGRCLARGGRCRLCAERLAGRADRQSGGAGPLYRRWHLGCYPAPRRHEGFRKSLSRSTRTRKHRSSRLPTMDW